MKADRQFWIARQYHLINSFLISSCDNDVTDANCDRKKDVSGKVALIRRLSVRYWDICSICSKLDSLYSLQNLMGVALCFIELTYGLYSGFYNNTDAAFFDLFAAIALWSGYFFYKLLMILFICTTTIKEVSSAALWSSCYGFQEFYRSNNSI